MEDIYSTKEFKILIGNDNKLDVVSKIKYLLPNNNLDKIKLLINDNIRFNTFINSLGIINKNNELLKECLKKYKIYYDNNSFMVAELISDLIIKEIPFDENRYMYWLFINGKDEYLSNNYKIDILLFQKRFKYENYIGKINIME